MMIKLIINRITAPAAIMIFLLVLTSCESEHSGSENYTYYTLDEVNRFIDDAHSANPLITAVEHVGTSVEGRPINALVISDNPSDLEMEPRIRISGGIHGNEKVTTEVVIRYIEYLLSEYNNSNDEITGLINSRYIVIIPVINPDGYTISTRYNANGVDLNRNFSREWSDAYSIYGTEPFSEPESYAVSLYSASKKFTTGITMHSGAVIVNMPFDYTTSLPAEDALVQQMGYSYSRAGTFLNNPGMLADSDVSDGTIFGGDWYVITGSMQDWSYLDAGCLDYTVEVAENKYPAYSGDMEDTYSYNRDSLTSFIKDSGYGVYGRVTDGSSGPLAGVKITIPGGDLVVYTDSNGYYHRLLLPGTYSLTFDNSGNTKTESITVPDNDTGINLDVVFD